MKLRNTLLLLLSISFCSNFVFAEENRIDQMISPAFHPVTFEDPRALSEARLLYVYHNLDDKFVTEGGNAQVYALQLRYALTDRLSVIATKDGYIDFNPKANVPKDHGFADVEAGLKYTLIEDKEKGYIASAQLRYLIPVGEKEVFQGQGDGEVHPSFSGAYALCENTTLTAGSGLRIPVNGNDSSFWDIDVQLDYRVPVSNDIAIYPLVGASLIKVFNAGDRLGIADEGQDFFNFGATGAGGENIVTGVAGIRGRLASNLDIGASFQFPLDRGNGSRVIDNRWTFDTIFKF
jgi:hypothetical protein